MNTDQHTLLRARVAGQRDWADRLLTELAAATAAGRGVTRAAYGPSEQAAHDLVRAQAQALGLETSVDPAGNLHACLPGANRQLPRLLTGSHLDSVPEGGNFDGAAGVIAGLMALAAIHEHGVVPPRDLVTIAIRAEESAWFPQEHVGSRAALGLFDPAELDRVRRVDSGRSLREHLLDAGCQPEAIVEQSPWLTSGSVQAFFELHIEQGPVLVEQALPVGVVTAIRGNFRYRNIACLGEYAHAGAVPRRLRRDALLAACAFAGELEQLWSDVETDGGDLVLTLGQFGTDPAGHAVSKVPGEVHFSLEVRSHDPGTLDRVDRRVQAIAARISRQRKVDLRLGERRSLMPARMDPTLRQRLLDACNRLGAPTMELASGAGHDAAEFFRAGIPAAMLFIRNPNGSHNPDERMDMDDFLLGVEALTTTLLATAADG